LADADLLHHMQQGEGRAFDELYNRYNKPLFGYFVRMLNYDKQKAEDALHDLFLKIIERPELFDKSRSFRTWVYSVAYNSCKNQYKHWGIVKEAHEEIKHTEAVLDEKFFVSAAARIDAKEFRKKLDEVLDELPVDKKTTFILRYTNDHSLAEIANMMDCSEGTVKSRLHYTIKILADRLQLFNPLNH